MKTLLIGDTHLMSGLILPKMKNFVQQQEIQRIILTGDYTDQWGATNNSYLYKKDLLSLWSWKQEMQALGTEVIMLAGNHDVPYLIDEKVFYSVNNPDTFSWIKEILFDFELQIAYQLDDYLVSHAGYTCDYYLEEWHLQTLKPKNKNELILLHNHIGFGRGGRYASGSPIWADLNFELYKIFHKDYTKQIVGHTPVTNIITEKNVSIIGIDTFSLTKDLKPIGNGDMLLYEDGTLSIVKNQYWKSEDSQRERIQYLLDGN